MPSDLASAPELKIDKQRASIVRAASRSDRNLYDLFIDEISSIAASARETFSAASALCEWLPADQAVLRQATYQIAVLAKATSQGIDETLKKENLKVPVADAAVPALLLKSINPGPYENASEPWPVVGIRIISAFRKISLQLAVQCDEASEFGFLLGAEALHQALRHWEEQWNQSAQLLQGAKSGFCAAAYMADVEHPYSFRPTSSKH